MKKKQKEKRIPCPRCKSTATKFCYYNNYNVNQPRHFCKNCQRYWTAGGAMRNVPVGAGRRKTKHSAAVAIQPTLLRFGSDDWTHVPVDNHGKRSDLYEFPLLQNSNPSFSAFWGPAAAERREREDKSFEEMPRCRFWAPKTLNMGNPVEAGVIGIGASSDAFLRANPAAFFRSLNFQEST